MAVLNDTYVNGNLNVTSSLNVTGTTTLNSKVIINYENDVETGSSQSGSLLVGSPTGSHLAFDSNKIGAFSNATTGSTLYLSANGQDTQIGGTCYFGTANTYYINTSGYFNGSASYAGSAGSTPVMSRTWQRQNDCNISVFDYHNQTRVFMYDSETAHTPNGAAGYMFSNTWDWGGGTALLALDMDGTKPGRLYTRTRQCGDSTAWSGWNQVAFSGESQPANGGYADSAGSAGIVSNNGTFTKSPGAMSAFTWYNLFSTADINTAGLYLLEIYINSSSPFWSAHYSGQVTWFTGGTNGSEPDEIYMHGTSHAKNSDVHLYARTINTANSDGKTYLQIASNINLSSYTYTIKMTRLVSMI